MANNNTNGTEKLLIKSDYNNLIYIDPNSVLDGGVPQPRSVEPENLVMYVNLEADLVSRSVLTTNDNGVSLISVASGMLNVMSNRNGQDLDTKWTESYTETRFNNDMGTQSDPTSQSFGIDNISIVVKGANFIPRVVINFIDVRGKTLFESPKDSPYNAFFHIPWPVFYLTVKGYFGKAIRYRLHMIKFNSRYNPSTGNFDIETQFIGSTYAYLADISLESILSAPYFYGNHSTRDVKFNEGSGEYERTMDKSSKGYRILASVYREYIEKGLLPKDFPVRTLRELIGISGRLDKILEREIFTDVIDSKILAGMKEYEDNVTKFESYVESWKSRYLSPEYFTDGNTRLDPVTGEMSGIEYYKIIGSTKNTTEKVVGATNQGTLENIVMQFLNILEGNEAFGVKRKYRTPKSMKVKTAIISCDGLRPFNKFYRTSQSVGVDINGILNEIYSIQKNFIEQRNKIEREIEEQMNEVVKRRDIGIGFEPTIRNIVGVLLANADTYIRLMKDVHVRAMDRGRDRREKLAGVLTDSLTPNDNIYPWPEVKSLTSGTKNRVLVYPGSREMVSKLQSDDPSLWPEVDFIENFYSIITKRTDTLMGDVVNDVLHIYNPDNEKNDRATGVISGIFTDFPYKNKSFSNVIYELYERVKYVTDIMPLSNSSIHELAKMEFENVKSNLSDDVDILEMLQLNIKKFKGDETGRDLITTMEGVSPFEKFLYYEDQIPTTEYIKEVVETGFKVEKYDGGGKSIGVDDYVKVKEDVKNYQPEDYRKYLYPFNSTMYLSYIGKNRISDSDLQTKNFVQLSPTTDFISTPIQPAMWVSPNYVNNLFSNVIEINGQEKHILNTPYFHRQLYGDFVKTSPVGKYVGSAYLLLSSIPFVGLDDVIKGGDHEFLSNYGIDPASEVLVSTILKEQGAVHYLPYHLILKWGSIYYRYKKYIEDGVDILDGVTTPIDGDIFFDNNQGITLSGLMDNKLVTRITQTDVGIHPVYETIYHQIINGYGFVNINDLPNNYKSRIDDGTITSKYRVTNGVNAWTTVIDNTKINGNNNWFTLLPCNGDKTINGDDFTLSEQENFRVIWGFGTDYNGNNHIDYATKTLPTPEAYFKSVEGKYSIDENYRKVIDLIAVFKPEILEIFEGAFIDFASEKLKEEVMVGRHDVPYNKFQDLLREVSTVDVVDKSDPQFFERIVEKQIEKTRVISGRMLSTSNIVKLITPNPREYDANLFGGFTDVDVKRFRYGSFSPDQMIEGVTKIKTFIGEDLEGYYGDFFSTMDVEVNNENVKKFRPLIYLYAGLRSNGVAMNKTDFIEYVKNNVVSYDPVSRGGRIFSNPSKRLEIFMTDLIRDLQTIKVNRTNRRVSINRGYNDDPIKLELYNYFKLFNDKWTSGNSIGQKLLMEEFLFLDRANKDIGDSVYISMDKLLRLGDPKNAKINLYSVISMLVQDTGFDIRTLPAYVNHYTPNANSTRITPSNTVAENVFGTFMDVDYVDSSPKIILQYVGPLSKHLEMSDINKKYGYKDDGYDVGNVVNNPIIVAPDVFTKVDFTKSNRVVAFEVSVGDQNQSIFKSVNLDQSSVRNTSESFEVLERLGRSENGSGTAQVDIGLWNIYRSMSYQCEVSSMGNMMIQPTMYFYLKNIPLFRGSYWITEVSHNISLNRIETKFKGTRIPSDSLPDPSDSFMASYRSLFDKVVKKSVMKVKESNSSTTTEKTLVMSNGEYVFDPGVVKPYPGEVMIKRPGMVEYGVPFNGFDGEKYIQLISFEGEDNRWLRAAAVEMGGRNNRIEDDTVMSILSRLTLVGIDQPSNVRWGDIKDKSTIMPFYSTKFNLNRVSPDAIINNFGSTQIFNPKNRREVIINNQHSNINKTYNGPINVGPGVNGYGIALSRYIMDYLSIYDGDVVYFRMI